MARLWGVVLAVFLTAASVGAVNPPISLSQLSQTVNSVWDKYAPYYTVPGKTVPPMFSLALSIPYNTQTNRYDVEAVGNTDQPATVKTAMINCKVYTGTRVVAATVLKYPGADDQCPNEPVPWEWVRNRNMCPDVKVWADFKDRNKCSEEKIKNLENSHNSLADHAEYRVFKNFDTTFNNMNQNDKQNDLMLFYCKTIACAARCGNPHSHFTIVNDLPKMRQWGNFAYVFSYFYHAQSEPGNRQTIEALANALGLANIYRCDGTRCFKCKSQNINDPINNNCVVPWHPQTSHNAVM